MPALDKGNPGVNAVATFSDLLEQLLEQAATAKTTATVEPALKKSDFDDLPGRVASAVSQLVDSEGQNVSSDQSKGRQFAMIETAARDLFSRLIVRLDPSHIFCAALTREGRYGYRIPGLCQGVEPPRYSLDPLR